MGAEAGHHENPGPDDCPYTQGRQLHDSQGAFQTVFAGFSRFLEEHIEWLAGQQICHAF